MGSATIAQKNWQAIKNSGNGIVTAVASRDAKRSLNFIQDLQAQVSFPQTPEALGSYDDLIASDKVDAIYIPLPTGLRKEWVIKAAQAGKHVVCEKPCGIGLDDVREMVQACQDNKVQFMDGVMFMHSQRLPAIRKVLDDGATVGRIRRMTASFSFCAPEEFLTGNIRMSSELEPEGCLGDLGWYCIRFFLWAMNWQLPEKVTGRLLTGMSREDSPKKVPTEFSGELLFSGGVSAGFYCSFLTENQQTMIVSGDKGYLQMSDFVLPFFGDQVRFETRNSVFDLQGPDFYMEERQQWHPVQEYSNSHPTSQETNLFRNFASQIQSGSLNKEWPEQALKSQQVMNACRESAENGRAEVKVS